MCNSKSTRTKLYFSYEDLHITAEPAEDKAGGCETAAACKKWTGTYAKHWSISDMQYYHTCTASLSVGLIGPVQHSNFL